MKHIAPVLCLWLLCFLMLSGCGHSTHGPADFYVASNGNDNNPGTYTKPFATLHRARDAVRKEIAGGLERSLTVHVRGGTYYLAEPLVFGPEDSGDDACSITYSSCPGETARIVGGVPVTGWNRADDGTWTAPVPSGVTARKIVQASPEVFREDSESLGAGVRTALLAENGRGMVLARQPNTGFFHADKPAVDGTRRVMQYKPDDIDPSGWNADDVSVYIWAGHDWFSQLLPVESVDPEESSITLGMDTHYPMGNYYGDRYYVRNVPEFLDMPGEYCIDSRSGTIKILPFAGSPKENEYVVSAVDTIIKLSGSEPDGIVQNLHFSDFDLSLAYDDIIRVSGAENCSFTGCLIENSHECGIQLKNYAQRITVRNNHIRHIGGYAVLCEGVIYTAPGCPDVNKQHVIENNHIHHCGERYGHGYAVMLYQSGENRVVHNHMHDMPRFAVMIKTMRYQVLKEHFGGLEWGEQWQYQHSRNNLIAYNHIHHTMQESEDAGAIDSWGAGRGNVYDHNLIYETGNKDCRWMGGIYIDDATDYYTVSNNIVWGVNGSSENQVLYTKGVGGRIINNIIICPPAKCNAVRTFFMAGERNDSLEFIRNIICFEGDQGVVHDFPNWSEDRIAVSDSNLYWKPKGEFVWSQGELAVTYDEWRELYGGKYDQHSVFADPLFTDPENRDYSLQPGSPALELGFEPIDTAEIGLTAEFPVRFARE